MKKFMSAILAVIMMFSIAMPVLAAEETTKNVDNTFDNFEPAPGKKAPDNWFDPYCYEADGRINKYCLNVGYQSAAIYCPEAKKIFTTADMGRTPNPNINRGFESYAPYEVFCSNFPSQCWNNEKQQYEIACVDFTQWYCPYCGKYQTAPYENEVQNKAESAGYSHKIVPNVIYGYQCSECEVFHAEDNLANDAYNINPLEFKNNFFNSFSGCSHKANVNEVKLYRFLNKEQRNAEYSFIFTETEKDFGDGKDGRVEDLKMNSSGAYESWESPDNPNYKTDEDKPNEDKPGDEKPAKKTFKDKLIDFFNKIAAFFAKIGAWFKKLFK